MILLDISAISKIYRYVKLFYTDMEIWFMLEPILVIHHLRLSKLKFKVVFREIHHNQMGRLLLNSRETSIEDFMGCFFVFFFRSEIW